MRLIVSQLISRLLCAKRQSWNTALELPDQRIFVFLLCIVMIKTNVTNSHMAGTLFVLAFFKETFGNHIGLQAMCRSNKKHSLPVSREGCESEHGHPDRGELNEGDDFAAHSSEQPLLRQVATGIHRSAGHQQQHVPQSEARHEQVRHVADTFGGAKCPDESDVAN